MGDGLCGEEGLDERGVGGDVAGIGLKTDFTLADDFQSFAERLCPSGVFTNDPGSEPVSA
ncbi:hypothetical protein [Streptomyces sp. NBC_00203]|uniref:hypothetical protein n=1 Tax=Streptomyces sp. NBC_00203 TaxID=2975680 RepID=UPI0032504F80